MTKIDKILFNIKYIWVQIYTLVSKGVFFEQGIKPIKWCFVVE